MGVVTRGEDNLPAIAVVLVAVGVVIGVVTAASESGRVLLLGIPALVLLPVVAGALPGAPRTLVTPLLLVAAGVCAGYLIRLGVSIPGDVNHAHDDCGGASVGTQRTALLFVAGAFFAAAAYAAWVAYRAAAACFSAERKPGLAALGLGALGVVFVCGVCFGIAGGAVSC